MQDVLPIAAVAGTDYLVTNKNNDEDLTQMNYTGSRNIKNGGSARSTDFGGRIFGWQQGALGDKKRIAAL